MYPTPQPPTGPSGGYTLPPTAAYFPVTAYTNSAMDKAQEMMSQESLNQYQQQPNTPDLLMHRRQVRQKQTTIPHLKDMICKFTEQLQLYK